MFIRATIMAAIATVALSGVAMAGQGHDPSPPPVGNTNNYGGAGGAGVGIGLGGQGGHGGNAAAFGGNASATSHNTNTNLNANENRNSNRNFNAQGQAQRQSNAQGQYQSNSATGSGNTSTYQGDTYEAPGIAPSLALGSPTAPCKVPVGVSVGLLGGGGGFAMAVTDDKCNGREEARMLWNMGYHAAALQVLQSTDDEIAKAMQTTALTAAPAPQAMLPEGPVLAPQAVAQPVADNRPITFVNGKLVHLDH